MTTELTYLVLTAVLTGSLWIPYVIAQVVTNRFLTPQNYVDPTTQPLPFWGKRADRTYLNAVEVLAPFAVLGIVVQLARKANAMTAFWAMSFFWLRVAHAVIYLLAVPYVRTVVFVLGYVALLGIAWELIR
ncbi:MAG: MAPEG family protein [Alphaproteobacteria bacterium]|nr:MAPEG family protein [Alphaproteobacteria bacterium]